ncbi:MAG: hypothetical protein ABIK89_18735 [Planctomycetota bacterium]
MAAVLAGKERSSEIPDDPMEILTWNYQAIVVDHNLAHVCLLMDLEANVGEVPDEETSLAAFRGTYGQFVEILMRIGRQ